LSRFPVRFSLKDRSFSTRFFGMKSPPIVIGGKNVAVGYGIASHWLT